MREFFITVAYSGLSPKAPGTVGSLVSLAAVVLLIQVLPPSTIFMFTILISVIAVKQIDIYEKQTNTHDSKTIVIDELVGMWFAFLIAGATADSWVWLGLFSFVYFRLFDILKPSIIGRIDKNVKGGLGVVGDDIVAGIAGGLSASLTYFLFEEFLL
jgi:phosphatidylglycerophosphatase A